MKDPSKRFLDKINVLHVGCGNGAFTEGLANIGFKSVLGIDVLDKCIDSI